VKYKIQIKYITRIQKPYSRKTPPEIERKVFYNRVGHWILHCEYGPAIEWFYVSPYVKGTTCEYYLRNRKMNESFWKDNLSKLGYK
jgi:hypothetical protein